MYMLPADLGEHSPVWVPGSWSGLVWAPGLADRSAPEWIEPLDMGSLLL